MRDYWYLMALFVANAVIDMALVWRLDVKQTRMEARIKALESAE